MSEISNNTITTGLGPRERTDTGASAPAGGGSTDLSRGTLVGRYVIVSIIGMGGMGVVYTAYDPELDRRVAIKVVHPRLDGDRGRARLVREAQALAKLNHPSVVTIHDVGTVGERVWIAMEFVEGETLREWAKGERRSWRDVIEAMVQAGRGLAAAHTASLLHRDFKPENVMVDRDGRVRVMDFGLARESPDGSVAIDSRGIESVVAGTSVLSEQITHAGARVGTPRYMAPEQHCRREVSSAADQFAFCVTLWELLYRQHPFADGDGIKVTSAVLGGLLRKPPVGSGVPAWLRRVCVRGLALDPEKRYPSMDAVLEALEAGLRRAILQRSGIAVSALAVVASGIFGYVKVDESRRTTACREAGSEIDQVWNDTTREAVRGGLGATGVAYAETTADRVVQHLDKAAAAWRKARTAACFDARVYETWDDDLLDRAVWCLDERRMVLEALTIELAQADTATVQKAVPAAAAELARIGPCRDEDRLQRLPAPPEEHHNIEEVRRQLSIAHARQASGNYTSGLAMARTALEEAEALSWPPLVAAAHWRVGSLLEFNGKHTQAEAALEQAYFTGMESGAADVVAISSVALVYTVGVSQQRTNDGQRWARHAEVAIDALGAAADSPRADLLGNLASIHKTRGEYAHAKELYERALDIETNTLGSGHFEVAATLVNLASVYRALGNHEKARGMYEKALSSFERAYGSDHPSIAATLINLGRLYIAQGASEQARAVEKRALEILEQALDPDHPQIAMVLIHLGAIHHMTGEYREAETLFQRALRIQEKTFGPEHASVATCLNNLGNIYLETGEHERARDALQRTLTIWEKTHGPDHPDVAMALHNLATLERDTGAHADAAAHFERALAILTKTVGPHHLDVGYALLGFAETHGLTGAHGDAEAMYRRGLAILEQTLGPEHPDLAYALVGLAEQALARGRPREARPLAERALAVRTSNEVPAEDLADARFVLARALWTTDRERALHLAERAREEFLRAPPASRAGLAELEAWLAKRTSNSARKRRQHDRRSSG